MLVHPTRVRAMDLALELGVLDAVMPAAVAMKGLFQGKPVQPEGDLWDHTMLVLSLLPPEPSFPLAMAAFLHDVGKPVTRMYLNGRYTFHNHEQEGAAIAEATARRLKLSNAERDRLTWLVRYHQYLGEAKRLRESKLKRMLAEPGIDELLVLHRADALASTGDIGQVEYCEHYLKNEPTGPLNPPPLLTGHDLVRHGLRPGPRFAVLLEQVREGQLEGRIRSKREAIEWVEGQFGSEPGVAGRRPSRAGRRQPLGRLPFGRSGPRIAPEVGPNRPTRNPPRAGRPDFPRCRRCRPMGPDNREAAAALVSGGLDSAILCFELLRQFPRVVPIYIRAGLRWEGAEIAALRRFLSAVEAPGLDRLVMLDEPVADVYGDHWSTAGLAVPDADTPDESVYLPGRNLLLTVKAAVWCRLRGVGTLALGTLGSNPFPDGTTCSSPRSSRWSTGRWAAGSASSGRSRRSTRTRSWPSAAACRFTSPYPASTRSTACIAAAVTSAPSGRTASARPVCRTGRPTTVRPPEPAFDPERATARDVPSHPRDRLLLWPPPAQLFGQVPPPPRP